MSLDVFLRAAPDDPCHEPDEILFSANITHNLGRMAYEAGFYDVCWRPEESGIIRAEQLIEPLSNGLDLMCAEDERFRALNSPNGWGLYDNFVPWVAKYLRACRTYPDALVSVCR